MLLLASYCLPLHIYTFPAKTEAEEHSMPTSGQLIKPRKTPVTTGWGMFIMFIESLFDSKQKKCLMSRHS